ncbi:fungal specific transcription factor domain containing protein [Sporothrix brasiliensis 5110]|uniref:Fungal specific transcription factor domain containing protein n=1 Tax=Sporothrix brasiliensis 5110 TaxID=1398154 RepID=A0A0C2FT28_9PEZI|nr:fungal specific transcription factor domain containing protein [Sporothrix brasiliensis 5110]KIH94143.1 fungal specific transcription factor domain containing protein [Sporothrix brasiliensis 5110]
MASDTRERQRRRKIVLACEPCRERKTRCDGRKPICSSCEHRSLGLEKCIYTVGNARTASSDDYTKALHERIRHLEHACALYGIEVNSAGRVSLLSNSRLRPPMSASSSTATSPVMLSGGRRGGVADQQPSVTPPNVSATGKSGTSDMTSPEQMDPEDATGVTAMGTVLSEEDLEGEGAIDSFYGRSSAASFLKEAASALPQRQNWSGASTGSGTSTTAATTSQSSFFAGRGPTSAPSPVRPLPHQPPPPPPVMAPPTLSFTDVDRFTLPPRALGDHLIQRFFSRIFYQYPFFDREAFEHAYQRLWQVDDPATRPQIAAQQQKFDGLGLGSSEAGPDSIIFHCALNAIFALGCCFSDLPPAERAAAIDVFGNRSKTFVGLELINYNNLGVVQAMLVISLVLQGTQGIPQPLLDRRRHGLPRGPGYWSAHGGDQSEPAVACLVSMTFGRPPMASSLSIAPEMLNKTPDSASPESLRLAFYYEGVKLSVILEDILQRIYKPWLTRDANNTNHNGNTTSTSSISSNNALQTHHNLDTVVEIQGRLDQFEQSVTPFLSWTAHADMPGDVSEEDRLIMGISQNVLHARFIYLQLILYRPILSQLANSDASPTTSSGANSSGQSLLTRDGLRYSFAIECGKSCVEAAKRLIVLVHSVYRTETTDIWWWNGLYACAAGLVLIVARSCPDLWQSLDRDEIAALWDKSHSILQDQALYSASARKSLDLLLKVNEHALLRQAAGENDILAANTSSGNGFASDGGVGAAGREGGGHRDGNNNNNNGNSGNMGSNSGLAAQFLAGTTGDGLAAAGGSNMQPGQFDFLAQMADPNAPTLLEDTYAMGPLFAWDQNIDFTNLLP